MCGSYCVRRLQWEDEPVGKPWWQRLDCDAFLLSIPSKAEKPQHEARSRNALEIFENLNALHAHVWGRHPNGLFSANVP